MTGALAAMVIVIGKRTTRRTETPCRADVGSAGAAVKMLRKRPKAVNSERLAKAAGEIGTETASARKNVTGPGVGSQKRIQSGWIPRCPRRRPRLIPRKTSSVGRNR